MSLFRKAVKRLGSKKASSRGFFDPRNLELADNVQVVRFGRDRLHSDKLRLKQRLKPKATLSNRFARMRAMHRVAQILLASAIRLWLFSSEYQEQISGRVEVSTPINSWKKVTEGVHILNEGNDPYFGDLIHEPPLNLHVYKHLMGQLGALLPLVFVLCDVVTALLLSAVARKYVAHLIVQQMEYEMTSNNLSAEDKQINKLLFLSSSSTDSPEFYVFMAYLFNPYIILSCVAMTTTVFTNLFLALFFYALVHEHVAVCCLSLAVCSAQSLYPVMLISPVLLTVNRERSRSRATAAVLLGFAGSVAGVTCASRALSGSWAFLHNVYGFILNVPDLRPNIGLFWYFFTEMFEHFRALFISAFQINVMFLYLVPLSVRFRRDPVLLTTSLVLLMSVFKSYPSLGDVGLCFALVPMWMHLFKYLQQGFFVCCCLTVTSVLGPVVWQLWIYSRSANANFYFGVTLSFATAQIFLVTDLLFAYIKRDFWLENKHLGYSKARNATLTLE